MTLKEPVTDTIWINSSPAVSAFLAASTRKEKWWNNGETNQTAFCCLSCNTECKQTAERVKSKLDSENSYYLHDSQVLLVNTDNGNESWKRNYFYPERVSLRCYSVCRCKVHFILLRQNFLPWNRDAQNPLQQHLSSNPIILLEAGLNALS